MAWRVFRELVATDLDGTLVRSDETVSDYSSGAAQGAGGRHRGRRRHRPRRRA